MNPDPDRSLDPCGYDPVADLHISVASGQARRKTHARYYTSSGFTRYEEWNQSIDSWRVPSPLWTHVDISKSSHMWAVKTP